MINRIDDLLAVSEVVVVLDRDGRVADINAHGRQALGLPPEHAVLGCDWIDLAVPAPLRDAARRQFAALTDPARKPVTAPHFYQFEHAIQGRGPRRVFRWRATLTTDTGTITGAIGHGVDITAERRSQRRLLENQQDLAQLVSLAQAVSREGDARQVVVDSILRLVSATAVGLYEPDAANGTLTISTSTDELQIGHRVGDGGGSGPLAALTSGQPLFVDGTTDHPLLLPPIRSTSRVRSMLFQPIVLDDVVVAVLGVGWKESREELSDRQSGLVAIAAGEAASAINRVAALRHWEHAAYTDGLTGVWNRRAFDGRLDEAIRNAAVSGQPVAVALIDLNGFKALNDTAGHAAGDATLVECATLWSAVLRPTDTLARLGGDEFAVVLTGCGEAAAAMVASKLRNAIRHAPGCGVGITVWDGAASTSELLHHADEALYRDKARQAQERPTPPATTLSASRSDGPLGPRLDALAASVAELIGAPMTAVALLTDADEIVAASFGFDGLPAGSIVTALCDRPSTGRRECVVGDAAQHGLGDRDERVAAAGLRAYVQLPIVHADGAVVGMMCAFDRVPRTWTADELAALRLAAVRAGALLGQRVAPSPRFASPA